MDRTVQIWSRARTYPMMDPKEVSGEENPVLEGGKYRYDYCFSISRFFSRAQCIPSSTYAVACSSKNIILLRVESLQKKSCRIVKAQGNRKDKLW
jgi:hypothetical protein